MNGKFTYYAGDYKITGDFNIYQARNGGIYLLMGGRVTLLSFQQIQDLGIYVYELDNFDIDDFNEFYGD